MGAKIYRYKTHRDIVVRFRDDLKDNNFVLLFAYNGTGKTRLSREFKDYGKKHKKSTGADTLYFNAFTEDLFSWDNDLDNDQEHILLINDDSHFFDGLHQLSLDVKIREYLDRYAKFGFVLDFEKPKKEGERGRHVSFYKEVIENIRNEAGELTPKSITINNIKISRGEENIFIWCLFLALCELVIVDDNAYKWVKYIYIDDPISSLDDNNVIAIASDLAQLLKKGKDKIKVVISSHHTLFFNVMSNELKKGGLCKYFLHKQKDEEFKLQTTDETPFFHHIAILSELKTATLERKLYPYHFNMLRSILEKTATFFGQDDFSDCVTGIEDEVLYSRALNLLSHGNYSLYEHREMNEENKDLFIDVYDKFLDKYNFVLPQIFAEENKAQNITQ